MLYFFSNALVYVLYYIEGEGGCFIDKGVIITPLYLNLLFIVHTYSIATNWRDVVFLF